MINLVKTLCNWCNLQEYPVQYARNAAYCLTRIPWFQGISKDKTFLALYDSMRMLQDSCEMDETQEMAESMKEVCAGIKIQTWILQESKNVSSAHKNEIRDKVERFKDVFDCEIEYSYRPQQRRRDAKFDLKQPV